MCAIGEKQLHNLTLFNKLIWKITGKVLGTAWVFKSSDYLFPVLLSLSCFILFNI